MRTRPHWKRKTRRLSLVRRTGRLVALALALVAACSFGWFVSQPERTTPPPSSVASSGSGTTALAADSEDVYLVDVPGEQARRVVYPYSVIPGGVLSVEELKNAIANDPVVSAQYAAFRVNRAQVVQLDEELSMHVSYRLGDRVFWTKRELRLPKGETVITDGDLIARTRCGNLLAEEIAGPVSPNEPTEQQLNPPATQLAVAGDPDPDYRFPPLDPGPGAIPTSIPVDSTTSGASPVLPVSPGPGEPNPFPIPISPASPPNPVLNTPEPGTGVLLLAALLALLFVRKRAPHCGSKSLD